MGTLDLWKTSKPPCRRGEQKPRHCITYLIEQETDAQIWVVVAILGKCKFRIHQHPYYIPSAIISPTSLQRGSRTRPSYSDRSWDLLSPNNLFAIPTDMAKYSTGTCWKRAGASHGRNESLVLLSIQELIQNWKTWEKINLVSFVSFIICVHTLPDIAVCFYTVWDLVD